MKIIFLSFILCFFVIGCGTSPTAVNEATVPAPDRIYVQSLAKFQSNSTLTLIRDTGLHGAEHVFSIYVNNTHVVDLRQGEKFSLPVDSAQVFIEARMFNVLGKIPPVQVETVFTPKKEYVYRVGLDEGILRLSRDLALTDK